MKFRRSIRRRALITALLTPFVVVSVGMLVTLGAMLMELRRIAAHRIGEAPAAAGPGHWTGVAQPGARVVSPLGVEALAWTGWVGRPISGKKGIRWETVCQVASVDGVTIRDARGSTRVLSMVPRDAPVDVRQEGDLPLDGSGAPVVWLGTYSELVGLPKSADDLCGPRSNATTVVYREAVLQAGAAVEVLGCSEGERLVPCADGFAMVSVSPVSRMLSDARSGAGKALLFCGLWIALVLGVVGALAGGQIVRTAPVVKERA